MRLKMFAALLLLTLAAPLAAEQPALPWCGVDSPTPAVAQQYRQSLATFEKGSVRKDFLPIPVAIHIITDGKRGKITQHQIDVLINNLNWAYQDTPFQFYLARVDVTKNKSWFNNCNSNSRNQTAMKKRLARDTRFYVNIYSCNPYDPAVPPGLFVLGKATFPFQYPNGSYLHGILLHPNAFPGGSPDIPYGLTAAHEVGHYLGLFHTFEKVFNPSGDGCDDPGDLIADTPTQAAPHFSCPDSIDSCPTFPGSDDVPNFMNYSTDVCMAHFTSLQVDAMVAATHIYRPNLGH